MTERTEIKTNTAETADGWQLWHRYDPANVVKHNPVFGTEWTVREFGGWCWVNATGEQYMTNLAGEGLYHYSGHGWDQMRGTMQFDLPEDRTAAIRKLQWYAANGRPWVVPARVTGQEGEQLSLSAAAALMGLSRQAFHNRVTRGTFPAADGRITGGDPYWLRSTVTRAKAGHELSVLLVCDIEGRVIDYDAAVNLMDDDLREELHASKLCPCSRQAFLTAYAEAHKAKFGEGFAPWLGEAW